MDHRIVQIRFRDATYRLQGASLHGQARQFLDGDVNWPAVMDALNEVSYRGWITVEPDGYRYLPAQLPARLSLDLDALFRSNSGRSR